MRNERTATLPKEERLLPELQNDGADSEDLSPFLAFWRSESSLDRVDGGLRTQGPWMMVDVSLRRPLRQRRPIIDRLFRPSFAHLTRVASGMARIGSRAEAQDT